MRGKKRRIFHNYYSKLTLVTFLSVTFLVGIILSWVLCFCHTTNEKERLEICDDVVNALKDELENIYLNYYKVFLPFSASDYDEEVRNICLGKLDGGERQKTYSDMSVVLGEVCKQDDRIAGVCFSRLSDGKQFIYWTGNKYPVQCLDKLEYQESLENVGRSFVGARIVDVQGSQSSVPVFGIQSGIVTQRSEEDFLEFQITVFYSVETFHDIVSDFQQDERGKFYVSTVDGLILYNSQGEYQVNESTYYAGMDKIIDREEIVTDKGIDCVVGVSQSTNKKRMAFYTVPQNSLKQFQFDNTVSVSIFCAVIIIAIVFFIMLLFNQKIGRRFQELDKGMRQIEDNNLKYRIPVRQQEDEFSRIAYRFNKMSDKLEDMFNKNFVYQILQQNAEYRALQTSVNPHFLYNSLEAIREDLEKKGQKDSASMILLMSRIFEYQIRGDRIVTILKEKQVLQNYIDFSDIRFQYAFDCYIDFTDEILKYAVPKLIFQPIMENYFNHGIRQDGTDSICITGYLDSEDDMIHICFKDNGKGMSQEQIDDLNRSLDECKDVTAHMGLHNVHNRLKIVFGSESYVKIVSNAPNPGVSVWLVFGKKIEAF